MKSHFEAICVGTLPEIYLLLISFSSLLNTQLQPYLNISRIQSVLEIPHPNSLLRRYFAHRTVLYHYFSARWSFQRQSSSVTPSARPRRANLSGRSRAASSQERIGVELCNFHPQMESRSRRHLQRKPSIAPSRISATLQPLAALLRPALGNQKIKGTVKHFLLLLGWRYRALEA
jgi:hypothetical protein